MWKFLLGGGWFAVGSAGPEVMLENIHGGGEGREVFSLLSQWLFLIKESVLKGLLVSCIENLLSFN